MADDRRTPSNEDILRMVEHIDQKLDAYRRHVEDTYVTCDMFESQINRMTVDVVRQVSATMQAMVKDAMTSALQEHQYVNESRLEATFGQLLQGQTEVFGQMLQGQTNVIDGMVDNKRRSDRQKRIRTIRGYVVNSESVVRYLMLLMQFAILAVGFWIWVIR